MTSSRRLQRVEFSRSPGGPATPAPCAFETFEATSRIDVKDPLQDRDRQRRKWAGKRALSGAVSAQRGNSDAPLTGFLHVTVVTAAAGDSEYGRGSSFREESVHVGRVSL